MRTYIILLGLIAGATTAWFINKLLSGKIKEKGQRIGIQVAAYIVFILFNL